MAPGSGSGSAGPLRVMHVFRAPLGGLFRHVVDVARGQIERGHAVGIFCDSSTGGERGNAALAELAPDLSLGLHRVPMRRPPHPLDLSAVAALTGLYRRNRVDVLHGHGSKGGAFARLVSVPSLDGRTARAYTPHGGSFNYKPGSAVHRLYMMAESVLARRTDVFLFESGFIKDRFETYVGATPKLTRIVHNGIADAEFAPLQRDPEPADLVYIGELRPAKGVEVLIDALARIRNRHDRRLSLVIVGSGPSEPELRARAKRSGVGDAITFVPPEPIRRALARGRVMVIPSLAESLPYVILEAAAGAQPLVSTNVGGIPEIFGPYADRLIKPGNSDVLARAILAAMVEDEPERQQRADLLSDHVRERFQIDRMVEGVLAGYRDALATRPRRG